MAAASDSVLGAPYWWEEAPRPEAAEAPPVPGAADVVIIGAGYSGLMAALVLARAGKKAVVLEAGAPGAGASSRNGGICSGNLARSLDWCRTHLGEAQAKALYREGVEARAALRSFIETEKIACHYHRAGRFTGAVRPGDYDALSRTADSLNAVLDIGVEMVPRSRQHSEVGTEIYHGGQVRHDIAGLHPGLFHLGLLRLAEKAGASVIGMTPLRRLERDGSAHRAVTDRGAVRTRDVIVATNGYSGAATPWLRRRLVPVKSQIIATEAIGENLMSRLMPARRMMGETRHLYHYYRPSPDGSRILFGGRARRRDGDPAFLLRHLTRLFPDLGGIGVSHNWWGNVAYSFDHLPHVANVGGVWYVGGFCGSGVVWAPWLGRKAALSLLGEPEGGTAFASSDFPARPLYSGNPWFLPAVIQWKAFRDWSGL